MEWLRAREGRVTRLDVQCALVGMDSLATPSRSCPTPCRKAARPLDLDGTPALRL